MDFKSKIGIIGGGQLGKMLAEAASPLSLDISIMDVDRSFPAGKVCTQFFEGDFSNYTDVMRFGEKMDVITIEIETIDTEALKELEKMGKKVWPQPHIIELIKDKGLQKQFYKTNNFPTASFQLYNEKAQLLDEIQSGKRSIPFVQKLRKDGYDGRGVHVVRHKKDLESLLDGACLTEEMADIDKELAVIVARSSDGETRCFPVVEMEFHPTANLVEFLFCPPSIPQETIVKSIRLATDLAVKMNIIGLLAVELFLTKSGELLVNEVAPRPHNSGHHTIEACMTSQYEQLIRILAGLPLGSTELMTPAVMINILGAEGHTGDACYPGLRDVMSIPGVFPHIYGKKYTKPHRKMGHATIIHKDLNEAKKMAHSVKLALEAKAIH
jgi:5-(carboxyamino)imidazole ribonucleotide synthase